MRRTVAGIWDVPADGAAPALIVLAASFFLGAAAGCILASRVDGDALEGLGSYISAFLAASGAGEVTAPALLPLLWETLRWPLITAVLGFTALGLLGIPILFAVRGFLLSFAAASFVKVLGGTGGLLAFLLFGISGMVSVPALFVLGVQGFNASRCLAGRALGEGKSRSPYGRKYFLRCGMCAAAFLVCVVLEYVAVSPLVAGVAGALSG